MYTDSECRFSTNKCSLSYTKQRSNVRQWFREWQECNKQNNLGTEDKKEFKRTYPKRLDTKAQ
jgi:hypothetical protein